MAGPAAAPDRAERLARIHRTWRRAENGRRWYHHWTPSQANFVQGIAPLVFVLPVDGALMGEHWMFLPTEWLAGTPLAGLLLAWVVVMAGNAALGAWLLRRKGAFPSTPGRRLAAVVLVSVPLLGLGFLARRPAGCEPLPSLPRHCPGTRLRVPSRDGRLAVVLGRLERIGDEPLVAAVWLWVGSFALLLLSCLWAVQHSEPPVLWGLYLLFHGVAAAALLPEGNRPLTFRAAGRGGWALIAFLPAPLAFLPFLVVSSRGGFMERWTLCGEARTSLGSMSRAAAWQRLRRFLGRRRSWQGIPWSLRIGPDTRAGVERRQDRAVASLARWKLAALVLEAGLVGWLGGARGLPGVDRLAVVLPVVAALAALAWCRVPLRRLAELARLRVPRPVRPGTGLAPAATALAALGLLVGREMATLAEPREALRLFVLAEVTVLQLMALGAIVLVPLLKGLGGRFDVVPLASWVALLLGLLLATAWGVADGARARPVLDVLGILAVTAPVWDLGAGWWRRRWLLRPFVGGMELRSRLGRGVAWLVVLPAGVLLLPAWWWLAARSGDPGDGDGS